MILENHGLSYEREKLPVYLSEELLFGVFSDLSKNSCNAMVFLERKEISSWVQLSFSFTGLLFHLSFQLFQLTSQASEQLGNCDAKHIFSPPLFELENSSRQSGFDEDHKRSA